VWISRVRVTGGFLNGLDISLSKGLNVIIGARGAGKTSLLELIRHAVGATHADKRLARQYQSFLDAVLGSGEVIVDLESDDGGRHLVVDAKGGGQRPDLSNSVLVLGQNELESIASDAASRLNLLDLRTGSAVSLPDREEAASLTSTLFHLRAELETLREESAKRARLLSDREVLAAQEAALLGGTSAKLSEQREVLRQKEEVVIKSNRDLESFIAIDQLLSQFATTQELQSARLADFSQQAVQLPDTREAQDHIQRAIRLSEELQALHGPIRDSLAQATESTREKNLLLREAAAPLRASLEKAESGLGQITSQLRNVDAELHKLAENDKRVAVLMERYEVAARKRALLLADGEAAEEALFQARAEIAHSTTGQIANNVVVVVEHFADSQSFRELLQNALRGSSTRATIIEAVAERVLPRQLLELIESADYNGLAAAADLAVERAERLLLNLNSEDTLRGLTQVSLTDRVDFRLQDGAVDKSVDELSTGQKCAVTLPVILSEQQRTLILDQPEDHLDNAYLVDHVVDGIQRRDDAQTIVATHNANIPVLGAADRVFVLSSDGRTGTVTSAGQFDDDSIVDWITGLMEGGREAFAKRSEFYSAHGLKL
jgi:energy-coupling factor transporter ATP-binding protein EcfA2